MSENLEDVADESGNNRNRNILMGVGGGGIIIACICIVAFGALLYFDPFSWDVVGLVQSYLGGSDSTAKVMPEDTDFYISFDVQQLNESQDLDAVIAAFSDASGEDFEDFNSLIEELDVLMADAVNLTITDDIIPWIGQRVGISVSNLKVDEFGDLEDEPDMVIAIEARDRSGADDFILKFVEEIEDQTGERFDKDEYEGVTLYVLDDGIDSMVIGRSKNFVLISTQVGSIEDAIDAQKGDSLADNRAFKDITNQLPNKRLTTMYFDAAILEEFTELSAGEFQEFGMVDFGSAPITAFAISLTVISEGIQVDFATAFDGDEMTDSQRELLEGVGEATSTSEFFPEDTFIYISGKGLEMVVDVIRSAIVGTADQSDYDEAMELFDQQYGFNPDDLFSILSGEFALGLMQSREGFIASQMDVPIGFLLLIGTSDEQELLDMLESLNDTLTEDPFMQVESLDVSGFTLFGIGDSFTGTTMLVYGVGEGFLVLGSGEGVVEDASSGDGSVADSQRFKDTWEAFPKGSFPVFYLDLEGLFDLIRESMTGTEAQEFNASIQAVEPLTVVAVSSSSLKRNTTIQTIIFFIQTD